MNDRRLTALFAAVGGRNGYDRTSAEFEPFRDFKIRWTRCPGWIDFEVSDYMDDAPDGVVTSMAETVFGRIRGDDRTPYPENVCRWISSDDFVRGKQPLYVRRFRGLSRSTAGEEVDLTDSYERLVSRGLVERDPDLYMGWAPSARSMRVGRASVLMKVVAMSDLLDDGDVPEDLLDYCLYAQVAHVGMGFNPGTAARTDEYARLLNRFPRRAEMEAELSKRNMVMRRGPAPGEVSPVR